ncbi:Hypothetical protein D9617_46g064380 [Elsinoe fawcettii]|nr:Hypothetical protein D9617_46g064380 [Elsinoe fawcettii]
MASLATTSTPVQSHPSHSPSSTLPSPQPQNSQGLRTHRAASGSTPFTSPERDGLVKSGKRRRGEDSNQEELPAKQLKLSCKHDITSDPKRGEHGSPVDWAEYFGEWPRSQRSPSPTMNMEQGNKRNRAPSRSNSQSYSQLVRDGGSPAAWTRRHEESMERAGLIMNEFQMQARAADDSRELCTRLLSTEYPFPDGPLLQEEKLMKILGRVRLCNEARVVRDVTPLLVPSPELLALDGHTELDHICEALNAEWQHCTTLCGPRPKPDFAAGIAATAFDTEEIRSLCLQHTPSCPNLFPEGMYFPFLICEVKSSDRPIAEAERQAMHSASIAVKAIVDLFRKTLVLDQVHRKILVFSVAHNNSNVRIFGHFPSVENDKVTFFRHQLYAADIATDSASPDWGKPYRLCRAIYEIFVPEHISRIKMALHSRTDDVSQSQEVRSEFVAESQESRQSQLSAQPYGQFKKPSLPSTANLERENDRLRQQLIDSITSQERQSNLQREDFREQIKQQREQMELQLKEQREQTELQLKEQREQMKVQTEQQNKQMEKQLEQEKKQMEMQVEQERKQKKQMEDQLKQQEQMMAQQKEIMDLLKQSLTHR